MVGPLMMPAHPALEKRSAVTHCYESVGAVTQASMPRARRRHLANTTMITAQLQAGHEYCGADGRQRQQGKQQQAKG